MKAKRILTYLLIILSLCLAITACAHKADDREPDPSEETSSPSSQTTTKPGETDPILTDPEDTETTGDGGPTDAPETSGKTQKSTSPTPVSQTKTQASSRSQTSSTVTLPTYTTPTYTYPTYTLPTMTTASTSYTMPSLTWITPSTDLSKDYEGIYNDYSSRLKKATPRLIDEYKSEIKTNPDVEGIKTKKVDALSAIAEEGIAKMNQLRHDKGGDYLELAEWVGKISIVYVEELAMLNMAFD